MTDRAETVADREPTGQPTGVTIAEAAKRLGLTTDAVRSRLHRGTLLGVKTADGVWLVFLDEPTVDQPASDRTPTVTDRAGDGPATVDSTALIEQLRSENDFLRGRILELEAAARELRQLAAREQEISGRLLPAGNAPQHAPNAPGATEGATESSAPGRKSWWRWWR
jgi:hypothetical protein